MRFASLPPICLTLSSLFRADSYQWSTTELNALCRAQRLLLEHRSLPIELKETCTLPSPDIDVGPESISHKKRIMERMIWVLNELRNAPPANPRRSALHELHLSKMVLDFVIQVLDASRNCYSPADTLYWNEFLQRIRSYFLWEQEFVGSGFAVDQMMKNLKSYLHDFFFQNVFFSPFVDLELPIAVQRILGEISFTYPPNKVQEVLLRLRFFSVSGFTEYAFNDVDHITTQPDIWVRLEYSWQLRELQLRWLNTRSSPDQIMEEMHWTIARMASIKVSPSTYEHIQALLRTHSVYLWVATFFQPQLTERHLNLFEQATYNLMPSTLQGIQNFAKYSDHSMILGPLYALVYEKASRMARAYCLKTSRSPLHLFQREVLGRRQRGGCELIRYLGPDILEKVFSITDADELTNLEVMDRIWNQRMAEARIKLLNKFIDNSYASPA